MFANSSSGFESAIMCWRWEDAPDDLKKLAGEQVGESLYYIPPEMLSGGCLAEAPAGLSFLEFPTKPTGAWKSASEMEEYLVLPCPNGGQIAIVAHVY